MEDEHEKAATLRMRDLGGDAAFFTIGVVLLLAGISVVPTWWFLLFAAGSATWNIGRMFWHLCKSQTALKRN
jgi:hypothetical protein